jgi:hypothetical protein
MEDNDVLDKQWFRYLVVAALLSGAGGGLSALTADTSDRYKATQAKADFALRDERITELRRSWAGHLNECAKDHADFEQRLRRIERQFHTHMKTGEPPL